MYKFLIVFLCVVGLNARIVGGVAIIVQDKIITLYDIQNEMQKLNVNEESARQLLVRKKLESIEIKKHDIKVNDIDVYEQIQKTASMNNMSVGDFYDAVLKSNGLNSSELKKQIKKQMLAQKLYDVISYSKIIEPSDKDLQEFFEMNKRDFAKPEAFKVVVYQSDDQKALAEKVSNPMFYSPQVYSVEKVLDYNKTPKNILALLKSTKINSFSQIVSNEEGGFVCFYFQGVVEGSDGDFNEVKSDVLNAFMAKKREEILENYFARLQNSVEIKTLR